MSSHFVEVWHGDLLFEEQSEHNYWSLLDTVERDKAKRFSRNDLQKKYIRIRGVLRKILSSYLNIEPQKLIIKTTEHGKPFLAEAGLYFNLSHKDNKFVIVVSTIKSVGIDLELCVHRENLSALVEKCFSKIESVYWKALPEEQKTREFYHFWVRKEAFVKAVGRGISLGLDQCVINPKQQTDFLSIPEGFGLASDWKIVDIELEKHEICTLVIKNAAYQYKQMKYQ